MRNGWFRESYRHSLAARGIKTSFKAKWKSIPESDLPEYLKFKVFQKKKSYDPIPGKTKGLIAKELSPLDSINGESPYGEGLEITLENGNNYLFFNDANNAEEEAVRRVMEDLNDYPMNFNSSFLERFINTEELKNVLWDGVHESEYDFVNESSEDDLVEAAGRFNIALPDSYMENLDRIKEIDEEINAIKRIERWEANEIFSNKHDNLTDEKDEIENSQEAIVDSIREELADKYTEERLSDPMSYLREMYDENDAIKEAIRLGGINEDDAAKAAVDEDGVAHFLATYDGDEIELSDGSILYRQSSMGLKKK